MHDFTDDINTVPVSTENIPQNDLRVEFDDFDDMRNAGEDAFRYYQVQNLAPNRKKNFFRLK